MPSQLQKSLRLLPLFGILVAIALFGVAAARHPGGFDWNRDYLSTLLRNPSNPARPFAIAGMLFLCGSVAFLFDRLARASAPSGSSQAIRIGGIGSMVYAWLTFTPLHDLMVSISLVFFLVAVLALLRVLYASHKLGSFVVGSACLVLLVASAVIYYTGQYAVVLPWAQRLSFAAFAAWLVALDLGVPQRRIERDDSN